MSALGKEPVLTHYVRSLRGCSKPVLARASDGELYVVKFANASLGTNLLFNESMGTELYRAGELPVPTWTRLCITETFLAEVPEFAELEEKPATGFCFGSRYCSEEECRYLEILPGSSFSRVWNLADFWLSWLLDSCADHTDNRQAIFRQTDMGQLFAIFVDHGHMFGGPRGEQYPNFQASRYLDKRIYPRLSSLLRKKVQKTAANIDLERLWIRVHSLPDEWKTESAIGRFADSLEKLATRSFLDQTLDAMMDAHASASGYRIHDGQGKRQPARAVLCPGVQVA